MDGVTGVVSKLGDFLTDLLAGSSPAPAAHEGDARAFAADPAARKEQQLARLGAMEQGRAADKAIDRIGDDMEAGRALKSEDIKALTRAHQEQLALRGDDGVRQMVEEARKHNERFWKEDERER